VCRKQRRAVLVPGVSLYWGQLAVLGYEAHHDSGQLVALVLLKEVASADNRRVRLVSRAGNL